MLAGVVLVALARPWESDLRHKIQDATQLTNRMETHCIGRFLIDMPAEAQVEFGQATIDGFNIAAFVETPEEFKKRLAAREAEIRAKPDQQGGNKNLESEKQVESDHGMIGKVFVHSRMVHEGTAANGLELEHYRNEGVALEALVHGGGISIDLGSDYYDPDQIWRLPRLVAQLVPNPDNKIPSHPGEELVRTFAEGNGARVYSFWYEVAGTEHNVLIPHFLFKMDTGKSNNGSVPSSLSKDAALGLWDRILSSVRLQNTRSIHHSIDERRPVAGR